MKSKLNFGFKLIIIFIISVCFTLPVPKDNSQEKSLQLSQQQLSKQDGNWYYFKKGTKIPVKDLINKNYTFFDLPQGINIRIDKTDIDELGITHYLVKLEKNGIPIEDAYYTIHYSKEGDLLHVVGKYNKNDIPSEVISPKVSVSEAFQLAKDAFVSSENIAIKKEFDMVNAELIKLYNEKNMIPPYLVYYRKNNKDVLKLCYRVDISSDILEKLKTVYVDASTGDIFQIVDYRATNIATVATVYNGSRSVQVEWRNWPYTYYYLRDESRATNFETRNSSIRNSYPTCRPQVFGDLDRVHKNDLNWPINFENNAASAHWAVQEAYNVFKNQFYRNYGTFSSSGGEIRMENNYLSLYENCGPFYQPTSTDDYIHVGQTIGTMDGYEGSLDVIAHEFTHGVMYRARGISGNGYDYEETGELMESFADIFGTVIEYYTLGATDFLAGTNLRPSVRRSLSNPRSYPTYLFSPANDNNCKYYIYDSIQFEVPTYYHEEGYWLDYVWNLSAHVNNSVQNYWFHLLANGGTQNGVTVTGIGLHDAAIIAYRNMVYYLSLGSTFDDMRQASIENAIYVFGECSNKYNQVMNAWAAVGVGTQAVPCLWSQINGPDYLDYGEMGYWSSSIIGGTGSYYYTWYIDDNYFSSNSSIYTTFYPDETTNYTISLEVSDGNLSDYNELYLTVNGYYQMMKSLDTDQIKLEIYPNPATESTTIEITDADVDLENNLYIIKLIDKYGKLLFTKNLSNEKLVINTSLYKPGTYLLIVQSGQKYATKELIIN